MNFKNAVSHIKKENEKWPTHLVPVPKELWPQLPTKKTPIQIFRSKFFLVQVFDEGEGVTRLTVNRGMLDKSGRWVDGITWDELQDLKRQAGFGEQMAVEIYPDDFNVVNDANMRHLWVLPESLSFAWKRYK